MRKRNEYIGGIYSGKERDRIRKNKRIKDIVAMICFFTEVSL